MPLDTVTSLIRYAFGVSILKNSLEFKEKHMTSTNLLFPQWTSLSKSLDPFTVGFDDVLDQIRDISETVAKATPGYPPYNIRQVKDNKYVIEMAVAGFARTDIEVTLEGNKLVIKGAAIDSSEDPASFIYKGIANRNFIRSFTLADKVEIKDAEIANGMLKVWLENMVKAQDAIKKIAIK
jgi:molecular chaperone IbpA